MEIKYLLLSLLTATVGFIIWYALCSSIRLPKSFQIQFDINGPYVRRILRRRVLGFLIYFLVPYLLIFHWNVLGQVSWSDLNISFEWNAMVIRWVLIFSVLILLLSWFGAGSRYNLTEYPEIRVTRWTPSLLLFSALSWLLYLLALEFLFRGLVLQSALMYTGVEWMAIAISAGLYGMIQYFKNNQIAVFAIPLAVLTCYATLDSGSLIPALFLHFVGGQVTEWLAIAKHPEIHFER